MSNAAAGINSGIMGADQVWKQRRPVKGTGSEVTYYAGTMQCIESSSGYLVKGSDTAGLIFDGLMVDSGPVTVAAADASGDRFINVEKPQLFQMKIASAVITDIGRKVFIVYDNEVGYTSSNSILVGVVERYIDATTVEIRPYWSSVSGTNSFDGETITFTGSTGVNQILIPDALADALSIAEGSNEYLTFITSDGSEAVAIKKKLTITNSNANGVVVGPNGATNPTLKVVTNVSSEAGGLSITGGADAVGVALAALGSNTNEPLTLDGKGSGVVSIGTVSTGGSVVRTKVATVAVGGTAIGNANAVNEGFYYVTGANDTAAVILPASVVGKVVKVKNTVANKILVIFPPVNSQINANGANNAYNIPAAATREFTCVSTTLWYAAPETIA